MVGDGRMEIAFASHRDAQELPDGAPSTEGSIMGAPDGGRVKVDAEAKPGLCESFSRGPLWIGRWTPRLGEAPYETKIKRPKRYTISLCLTEWAWSSPINAAPLSWLDILKESLRRG